MTIHSRIQIALLACAVLISAVACENQADRESAIRQAPHKLLPSNARMVFGVKPRAVAANPVIAQIRQAAQRGNSPLLFTRSAQLLGLTPRRDLDEMIYALYQFQNRQAIFAVALVGDFQEQDLIARAEASIAQRFGFSGIEEKDYQGVRYAAIGAMNGGQAHAVYVAVPAQGMALASNNEALIQKGAAIWLGRADNVSDDPTLAPLMEKTDLNAPIWVAGLSEGSLDQISVVAGFLAAESLGRGVETYYGDAALSENSVRGALTLSCSSSDSAERQAANYKDVIASYAQNFVPVFGPGAAMIAEKIQVERTNAAIGISIEMTAEEADEAAAAIQQTGAAPVNPDELIRQAADQALRRAGRTPVPAPNPAAEEEPSAENETAEQP